MFLYVESNKTKQNKTKLIKQNRSSEETNGFQREGGWEIGEKGEGDKRYKFPVTK